MKNQRPILSLAIAVSIAVAVAPAPLLAQEAEPEERAEALERKGREAAGAGKLDEAAAALRASWNLAPWSSTACNLGRVEFARRRFRDAAELLSLCVDSAPPVRTPDEKKRFAAAVQQLAEARANIVSLVLVVNEPHAAVLLDGQRTPTPLPRVLFTEPGRHHISASLEGFTPASAEVQGSAGETLAVNLTLRALPRPPTPAQAPPSLSSRRPPPLLPAIDPPRPPPSPQPEPPPSRTLAVALFGAGAGMSAAVGVTSSIFAGSVYDAMERESKGFEVHRGRCTTDGCGAPKTLGTYTAARVTAISALVLSGVLGAAACATGLWPRASTPRTKRASLPAVIAW